MIIRQAEEEDVRQISEIVAEDWKTAYRGIMDSDFLDSITTEDQYRKDMRRYSEYTVAAERQQILGFAWNRLIDEEDADCEVVALYVRLSERKKGIGRALLQDAADTFRKAGRKSMIIWCLKENAGARRFYEKTGGIICKTGTHQWGDREYDIVSYLYRLQQ